MSFLRFVRAVLGMAVVAGCLLLAAVLLWTSFTAPHPIPTGGARARLTPFVARVQAAAALLDPACRAAPAFGPASEANSANLQALPVSPFGLQEVGWAVYAPLAAHEIDTTCAPQTRGFASALARWQGAHGMASSGTMDTVTLSAMATKWLLERPFVRAMKTGCPASPNEATLVKADATESYGGKAVLARPAALTAYRQMVAAARTETGVRAPVLTIASAYRGPLEEAARCLDGGCGNPARAHCSAHRTGLAFDLYLGGAGPNAAFSTAPQDRLALSRAPAYRWLVLNAARFGFLPYPYEPWHWEWTGAAV